MIHANVYNKGKYQPKVYITIDFNTSDFDVIIDYLKSCNFSYNPNWRGIKKAWVKNAITSESNLKRLEDLTEVDYSNELITYYQNKSETERVISPYKPDILKFPPFADFQAYGIKKGISQNRLFNQWEQGLGKSYFAVGVLNHLFHYNKIDSVLIVAPPAGVYNFKREIEKLASFPVSQDDFYIVDTKHRLPFISNKKFIISSYRSFLMVSDDGYKEHHNGVKFKPTKKKNMYTSKQIDMSKWGKNRAVFLDESHKIKNMNARQTKALMMYRDMFYYRYLLSGTPCPNGIQELYSQMKFLDEGAIAMDYSEWIRTFAQVGSTYSENEIISYDSEKVAEVLKKLQFWYIRELSKDHQNLPIEISSILTHMNEKQREIYQLLISEVLFRIQENKGYMDVREVTNKFPYLLQAITDPCLLKGKVADYMNPRLSNLVEKWKFKENSKLDTCSSLLEEYVDDEHKKVIIWSGHPKTLDGLAEYYKKYNPIVIHGEIEVPKGEDKTAYQDRLLSTFKNDPNHKVLLASFLVLSEAVDITESSRTIYFDRGYDLINFLQSRKRNHRHGQDDLVKVNYLIMEESLEEHQDMLLDGKETLNNHFHEHQTLTKDEWKSIFAYKNLNITLKERT